MPGPRLVVYRIAAGPVAEGHWYHDPRQGGRLLGEVCHFIDTARVLVGRPVEDVAITQFDCNPNVFMVEGEAPNATQATDYAERIRADHDLYIFRIEAGPAQILPNEHGQFRIYGKL